MSSLTAIQDDVLRYKEDEKLSHVLRDIQLTPGWKAIIEEGFIKDLSARIISSLAGADAEEKQQHLAALTGISVLGEYLEAITRKGALASINIRDAEDAISILLQEGQYE